MFEELRDFLDLRQRTQNLQAKMTNSAIRDRLAKVQQELYDLSILYEKEAPKK
jgi:hypothetical protein